MLVVRNNTRVQDKDGAEVGKLEPGIYRILSREPVIKGLSWVELEGLCGYVANISQSLLLPGDHCLSVPFVQSYQNDQVPGRTGLGSCLEMLNHCLNSSIDPLPEQASPLDILNNLGVAGLDVELELSLSYGNLKLHLLKAPAMLAVRLWDWVHYVLAVGYTAQEVIIHDPWNTAWRENYTTPSSARTHLHNGQYRFIAWKQLDEVTTTNKGHICTYLVKN